MADGYQVARDGVDVYVQVVGLANMRNTPVLDGFLRNELEAGALRICIDLARCTGMDSTFMGTLVGYHKRLQSLSSVEGRLVVLNPSPANRKLLDMLGLSVLLPVVPDRPMDQIRTVALTAEPGLSAYARAAMIQQAHLHLVALSEQNRLKFSSFLSALAVDLARLESGGGGGDKAI